MIKARLCNNNLGLPLSLAFSGRRLKNFMGFGGVVVPGLTGCPPHRGFSFLHKVSIGVVETRGLRGNGGPQRNL
jgi:hypothetical protein